MNLGIKSFFAKLSELSPLQRYATVFFIGMALPLLLAVAFFSYVFLVSFIKQESNSPAQFENLILAQEAQDLAAAARSHFANFGQWPADIPALQGANLKQIDFLSMSSYPLLSDKQKQALRFHAPSHKDQPGEVTTAGWDGQFGTGDDFVVVFNQYGQGVMWTPLPVPPEEETGAPPQPSPTP